MKKYLVIIVGIGLPILLTYLGGKATYTFYELMSERMDIARNGVMVDGEITGLSDMGTKRKLYTASYKFHVEGYENPSMGFMHRMQEDLKQTFEKLPDSLKTENSRWFDEDLLSRCYGKDVRASFGDKVAVGDKVQVMFMPGDPSKNIGGDHRSSNYWEISKGYRIIIVEPFMMFLLGVFLLGTLIKSWIWPRKEASNQSLVVTPLADARDAPQL